MQAPKIHFKPMTLEDIPFWDRWVEKPHVKNTWFLEGYHPPSYVYQKIAGNGYDYPFIILADEKPIGYIVTCDLYAYRTLCPQPKGLFTEEDPGTFGVDLFIAEEDYLDKGYGTHTVRAFVEFIFQKFNAHTIVIDPAEDNRRAVRCYEKAGFQIVKKIHDGISACLIMKIQRKI